MSTKNDHQQQPSSQSNGGTIESQFDDLLSLVIARSRGEVGNDAVERALASIIPAEKNIDTKRNEPIAAAEGVRFNKDKIIEDTDDYDDDEEEENPSSKSTVPPDGATTKDHAPSKIMGRPKSNQRVYEDSLENIPLGKMGSRMLITFGDGTQPHPEVVSAALLGARSALQRAVLDARALHRRLKDQWYHARAAAMHSDAAANRVLEKTTGAVATSSHVMDNELSFRALDGFDSMRNNPSCGFDVKALEMLFPEEMGAYQRWKKMHEAYTQNSGDQTKNEKTVDPDDDDATSNNNNETTESDTANIIEHGGRLYERMGNFDARTSIMGHDSYLQFSDVRRGSFLPRKNASNDAKEFSKSNRKRGRPSKNDKTTWTNLHPSSIVFLHWLGFDPMSSLPPPDEETTQALGFLAHDFLGKIVEKAVATRLVKSNGKSHLKKGMIPELLGGEQLELGDIEQAVSETCTKSLYNSSGVNSSQVAQLYFGPGFEDRLEMELDEIFGSKNKMLTKEELKMRQDEESLFSSLAGPPTMLGNLTNLTTAKEDNNKVMTEGTPAKRKKSTEDPP